MDRTILDILANSLGCVIPAGSQVAQLEASLQRTRDADRGSGTPGGGNLRAISRARTQLADPEITTGGCSPTRRETTVSDEPVPALAVGAQSHGEIFQPSKAPLETDKPDVPNTSHSTLSSADRSGMWKE